MNYEELKNSMPEAIYFYFGVDRAIIDRLPSPAWWGQTAGVLYCGTTEPIPALVAQEVVADAATVAAQASLANRSALEVLQTTIATAIQLRLDAFAQTRRYDNINSLASYAGDADPIYNAEGTYGKLMRSETWRRSADLEREVAAGTRSMPTNYADVETELPALVWPT